MAAIFGTITGIRNYLFDRKIIKSVRFDFPVIGVGNLTAGGTGKTPHIEYLITLLQYTYKIATLSRGYGRKSHGFLIADRHSTASQIGDEPRDLKKKFPLTVVAVGEDRVLSVPAILAEHQDVDVLLLDDVFQHRNIQPGISILLTEYSNLFTRDSLMPVGWLRESKKGYHRADIIVVSKCPADLSQEEQQKIIAEIRPFNYQKVYFSLIYYGKLYSLYDVNWKYDLTKDTNVLLVTGIADNRELKKYVQSKAANVYTKKYRDHHRFDVFDLQNIHETFKNLGAQKKVIVTTEKDAARLEEFRDWFLQNKIEIFVQPVAVDFFAGDKERFAQDIVSYIEITKQKITTQENGRFIA